MALLEVFSGAGVGGAITATFRDGYQIWEKIRANFNTLNAQIQIGTSSPEGVVTATVGKFYVQTDGVDGTTLWLKVSGTGNTGWTSVQTATSFIRRATLTLTNDQIKALPTTPITAIAAPSSGYRNKILAGTIKIDATAGAYTNINTTYCDITLRSSNYWAATFILNDNTTSPALSQATALLGSAAIKLLDFLAPSVEAPATTSNGWVVVSSFSSAASDVNGSAISLGADNNGSGNFTGGHASNSGKVTLYYAVEPL